MHFWLIQRGHFKDTKKSDIDGIDSLVSFDYMGAAEFEYGALPKALKETIGKLDELQIKVLKNAADVEMPKLHAKNGAQVFVISTPEQYAEVCQFVIDELSDKRHRLKEWTSMAEAIAPDPRKKPSYNCTLDFWWDIVNNWFVVIGKANAENVLLALQKVKEKKGW
jgi:hypothetical protein